MARAISVTELYTKKHKVLPFDGKWAAHIGQPEAGKSWIVWGDSSHGKTSYALQLAKYLTRFGKVIYNSREEGDSVSMKLAFMRAGMEDVKGKIILLDNESTEDLDARLSRKNAPRFVIDDTIQYSGMNYNTYKELKERHPKVMFIYLSHQEGKLPDGKVAQKVRRDAMVKVRVEGFKAFPISRYGGAEPYIINEEKAQEYWTKF